MLLRNLMNGVSLSAMMLRDADDESGSADPRTKLRESLTKNVMVTSGEKQPEANEGNEENNEEGEEEGEEEEEGEDEENEGEEGKDVKEGEEGKEETEEEKKAREAQEKQAAKAQRKADRMQRRIDEATAARKAAEAEVARLKAQLEANPEQKLTEEEVEAKAEALAAKRLAERQAKEMQEQFDAACEKLAKDASKVDKDFNSKINEIAEQFGPIPSFMIGVLEDFENGGEVLAYIANDDDIAEQIYSYKNKPAKLTKELVAISNQLIDAKKPKPKQLSKVPDPVKPVGSTRVVSNVITEADTKNMESYVAKRQRQIMEKRKAQGFS